MCDLGTCKSTKLIGIKPFFVCVFTIFPVLIFLKFFFQFNILHVEENQFPLSGNVIIVKVGSESSCL